MKHLEAITNGCNYLLKNFPGAKDYKEYLDSRITSESQDQFKFGYLPGARYMKVLIREVGEDPLLEIPLFYKKEVADSLFPRTELNCPFENHPLIITYRDVYGNVVGFIGRTLLSEEVRKPKKIPKYRNTDFKKGHHLYGLFEAKEAILAEDCVYIVEGQFDVIKAHEVGFKNVVAISNSQMTAFQFALICRYTKNINMLLDNDQAGDKGRKLVRDKFGKLANIRDFYIPEPYKDLDECIKENQTRPVLRIKK